MRSVKTKCQQVIAVSAHGSGGQISMVLETVCKRETMPYLTPNITSGKFKYKF